MGKGYAEGSAVEERLAALERGDDLSRQLDSGRAAVYGSTEDDPETHFIGWLDDDGSTLIWVSRSGDRESRRLNEPGAGWWQNLKLRLMWMFVAEDLL